ncbi:MAG: hypothetical protein KAY65_16235 [Planctomycetes bacterium]|nr:hypothetical protein [Planctomycetota bacterium]
MNVLLAQIILAARGEDMDKWTNVLFVVVLAVFWVVGSIIKAKSKKPEGEEEKEGQLSRKPGGKLKEVAERIEKELSQSSRDRVQKPPEHATGPQTEEPSRQPGQQARPAGPAARTRYAPQAPRRPRPAGRPEAARKPSVRPKPTPTPAFGLPEGPKVSPVMPEVQTGIAELPEYISKRGEVLEDKYAHISAERPAAESALERLLELDYADTDELRRAILHYEILGRPLSLRGRGEQLIGL